MRNNTNSYRPQATPFQILGELDGSNLGPQQTNKKKIVRRSRIEKADIFFEDEKHGAVTGLTIAGKILQNYLVFRSVRFAGWKEPGESTITIKIAKWIASRELPTIIAPVTLKDGPHSVQRDSKLVNIDQAKVKLLNLDDWDYKTNVDHWEKHKVKKHERKIKHVRTTKVKIPRRSKLSLFLKFLIPWKK